jgi:hypothetical protein
MFQEIVTYLVIALAVSVAVTKTAKSFSRKKPKTATNFKNETCTPEHNCSTCSDECALRNTFSSEIKQKKRVI